MTKRKHLSGLKWSSLGVFFFALATGSGWAAKPNVCYVTGDTSGNNPNKPLGSQDNPYGSLADVAADLSCETITVLYSPVVLNGGITLRDSQKLEGKKGPGGALPSISNSSDSFNGGHGVVLASDNEVTKLHIRDTWSSALSGTNVGSFSLLDNLITGFGQSGIADFILGQTLVPPGLFLLPDDNTEIKIERNDIGEADTSSIVIAVLDGVTDVLIEDTNIRNQGHNAGNSISTGALVVGLGASSVNIVVKNSSVDNIGAGDSNSDGMAFLALNSATVKVEVDGYSYRNPDGDGGGSATGLELANLFPSSGASFEAEVKNSTFLGGSTTSIQILNEPGEFNTLSADIHDNQILDSGFEGIVLAVLGPDTISSFDIRNNQILNPGDSGILLVSQDAPNSTINATIEDNLVSDAGSDGIVILTANFGDFPGPIAILDVLIEGNTVIDNAGGGLAFVRFNGPLPVSSNLDAGLGVLGSVGENRVIRNALFDIRADGLPVTAKNNWWGSRKGPDSVEELNGGTVDYIPFLTRDPDKGRGR